jgi:hypothetical protein
LHNAERAQFALDFKGCAGKTVFILNLPSKVNNEFAQTHLVAKFVVPKLLAEVEEVEEVEKIPCYLLDRQDLLMRLRTHIIGVDEYYKPIVHSGCVYCLKKPSHLN